MSSFAYSDFYENINEIPKTSFDKSLRDFYLQKKEKVNKSISITPPDIDKKIFKTVWKNFKDFLKDIRREPDQVIDYIKYNCEFPVDKVTSRVRDGISFNSKGINSDYIIKIMKKYTDKFVQCPQCNSCKTKLAKHALSVTWTMKCKNCGSENIVSFK